MLIQPLMIMSLYVTISVGIVIMLPRPGQGPVELLESAHKALYQAKEQGRNRMVVS